MDRGIRIRRGGLAVALLIGAVTATASLPARAQQLSRPVVTNAVQVTTNPVPVRAHSSPQVALNPNSGELVLVETDVFGDFGVNVHVSTTDGRTWFPGGDPMTEPFTWNSDYAINGPYFSMAFDRSGELFLVFTATDPAFRDLNRAQRPRHFFLARSRDSGRSWTTTMAFEADPADETTLGIRRPMLAIDPNDSDRIYLGWLQGNGGWVIATADGGRTFTEPMMLGPEDRRHYQPRLAVDSEGTVHAAIPSGEFNPAEPIVRQVWYRNSTDGGATWSEMTTVEPGSAGFFHNRKHLLAVHPDTDHLYLLWYGSTKELAGPSDLNDIFVRISTDGGATWSDRVVVNDDAAQANAQHYDPGISFAPNGRIDVAWYDFRNSPQPEVIPETFGAPFNHGGFQDVYLSSSVDGGRTWSPNVRVTDRLIDRNIGVWSNNVHSHYNVAIASSDAQVFVAWQDTRNGDADTNSEDIYFASVAWDADELVAVSGSSGVSPWVTGVAGLALGMGVAMVLAWVVLRGDRRTPARA